MTKTMWKSLVILWICLTTSQTFAKESFQCGEYEFQGRIRNVDNRKVLKLNEESLNETTLALGGDLSTLAEMYVDDFVTVKGRLFQAIEGYKGQIYPLQEAQKETKSDSTFSERYSREDIKKREADPLHPDLESSVKLLKAGPCSYKEESKKKTR
jgi:hypothetical protein